MEPGIYVSRRSSFVADCRRDSIDLQQSIMTPAEATQTQKPYRYGMILLCFGALINWVGLAENYTEPIRYAGVACIVGGALLICTAMCCWLQSPNRVGSGDAETDDPIHIIATTALPRTEKPPEYESVVMAPPNYDDAIKLDPMALLQTNQPIGLNQVPSYDYATSPSSSSSSASSSSISPTPRTMMTTTDQCTSNTNDEVITTVTILNETRNTCTEDKQEESR